MEKQLVNLIKELVAFESIDGRAEEKQAVVNFVDEWFKGAGIDTKIYDHEESPSLVVTLPGKLDGKFLMVAHLDVVPANKEMFKVVRDGDVLRGRGVIDNKGPAVALMLLLKRLKSQTREIPTIQLMFNTDEEIGGADGAGRLVNGGIFNDVDAVFIPDGGNKREIVCKSKGIIHLLLEVSGKAAHGSRPWKGENAIDKAWKIYEDIKGIFKDEDFGEKNNWHATVNLGLLQGGTIINQVPDKAQVGIDIRFTERFKLRELKERVGKTIDNRAKILKMTTGDLLDSNEDHSIIKSYCSIMGGELGCKIVAKPEHGASDARYFNSLNVPIWIHYPNGGEYHAEGEWVSISSIEKMIIGLEKFLKSFKK